MNVDLGYRPRPWQHECHTAMRRFTVLALHRRAGKTELALMHLLHQALSFNLELGLFFYVAPQLKQAKAIAWLRLKQLVRPLEMLGLAEINEGELFVKFPRNGAVIRIYGADNPDAMRGVRLDGAVIDEVGQIKPEVWHEVVRPALSDRKGWALFIGTPKGINLFSELFFKAKDLPEWYARAYTVYQTNALPPAEVAAMRAEMTEVAFAREFLVDFAASGEDQLISLADVEVASQRHYHDQDRVIASAPRILGVDPARFGSDASVIFPRQGLKAFTPHVYRGIDNMALADAVAKKAEEWQPHAVFIDAGNGAGVIDRLRQMGHDVIEVPFAGKSTDPQFLNKRAEIWHAMAEWLRAGGAIPDNGTLKRDLAAPTYKFDQGNRIVLEPKADIKARLGDSPDLGDALALTFSSPVTVGRRYEAPGERESIVDYDPISVLDFSPLA